MTVTRPLRAAPRILIAALALLASACAVQARVVGVVFDDSGSMIPREHLPTFGVQLLVSTLDGRPGSDRLLTLRLSEGPPLIRARPGAQLPEQPIRDARQLQGTIDRIRTDWPRITDGTGTPYAAVDVMLRGIVAALKPGETGFLVVVSDGGFGDPPDPATLRRIYETYKAELDLKEASLRVEFLLIAFPDRAAVEEMVEKQQVRKTLLEVFNGAAPNAGAVPRGQYDVTDIKDLMRALKTVVADVSGTAENLSDTYVRTSGAVRTIDSPLAISRIVTVATAPDRQRLPHLRDTSFQGAERVVYASRMDRADVSAPSLIQVGETTQLVFAPRLLFAGAHSLTFDRPIGDDVTMIFQTAASVRLDVLTEAGAPVPTDGQGRRILARGVRYTLAATLVDETPQGPAPVPLTALRGRTTFEAILDRGNRRLPMTVDAGSNRALAEFSVDWLGDGTARGEVALEGFVTSPSQPVKLVAVDGATTFETTLRGLEPCRGCAAGTIGATFDAAGRQTDLADVTLTPRGSLSGKAKLDRAGLPPWVEVIDESGTPVADGAAIPIVPGTAIRLKLRRSGILPADVPAATVPFSLALRTEAPLSGDGTVQGAVQISAAPADLRFREHRGPDDGSGRLVASASALRDGGLDLVFALEGAVTSNTLQNFTASYDGRLVEIVVADVAGGRIVLRPQVSRWCVCFLWFSQGIHRVRLDYRGPGSLQTATADAEIVVAPSLREIVTGCAELLGLILLLAWLLGAAIITARTARFPKESVAEIQEGSQLPRYVDLRRLNLTFLKALLWPIRRLWTKGLVPHEHRLVDGLTIVARRGGYLLKLDRDMSLEVRGQNVQDMLALNPRLAELRMNWREVITLHGPPATRVRLLRSLSEGAL